MTFLSNLLLWSGVEAAVALSATLLSNCADDKTEGEKAPLLLGLVQVVPAALLYNFIIFYFVQPSQEGFLFGQGWTLFFAALFFLGWLPLSGTIKRKHLDTIWACFLILILLECMLWCGTAVSVYAGAGNAERFASLANVEIASSDEKLPEPDERHRMLVTPSIARYLGQQAINSVPGNLGSLFMVRPEEWVRQSIQGHLWYAAPLEYANPLSQFGILSQKIDASPGFVLVDAENPNAEAKVVSSSPLRYLPGAFFQQNLFRHIYQHGYTMIDYPSLEVDDEMHPHFTAAVLTPRFGVAGTMVKKIIVVDATTGDISEYEAGAAPAWLDRVFSANLVRELVNQWGLWSAPQSRAHWPNWAGQYQMVPEEPELVYNASDIPVWLLPMRSRQSTNASSTGVMLFDTRDNKGVFYPGLSGLGVGENVIHTFQNASSNIRAYPVDTVQLYAINSVPTWVAVYTQQQGEHGESFAAVGLVDARHLNGANVIMAADMNTALSRYAQYLASGGGLSAAEISRLAQLEEAEGEILRIGQSLQGGDSTYHILLSGQDKPFTATLNVSEMLPLMEVGDSIKIRYLGSKTERAVTQIEDKELEALLKLN